MLAQLNIENAAVIEKAQLDFEQGFTVLTGETGAGKSIIIDSVNALLGERTSRDLVRTGAKQAQFTGVFTDIPPAAEQTLARAGIEGEEDGTLILSRSITADGRSVCRINGNPVTVSTLKSVGTLLINIHGQHDSQALLDPSAHCRYLDMLAHNGGVLNRYREKFYELKELEKRFDELNRSEQERAERLDYLRFQVEELENADISPGEMQSLNELKKRHRDSQHIQALLHAATGMLNGDEDSQGALGLLYSASDALEELKKYYSSLGEAADGVKEAVYAVEECISSVSSCMEEFEYESIDINAVEERLDVLWRLSKKYGADEQQLLKKLDELRSQCDVLENSDNELNLLSGRINEKKDEVYALGQELSETRRIAGNEFSAGVMRHLAQLDMPSVILMVERTEIPAGKDGIDSIRFLISVNPGEAPKELNKVASGGELSRIMLAIKSVLAGIDGIPTMIFDEIDTGVSGSAAGKMAKKLKNIACDGRQVICVTHLAKLACYASNHFYISKHSEDGVTRTNVKALDEEERTREIARIIGGETVTSTALKNAKEMLILAQNDEIV